MNYRNKLLLLFSILIFYIFSSGTVLSGPGEAVNSFPDRTLESASNYFVLEINSLIETMRDYILYYPDPYDVKGMVDGFIRILIPLYVIAIIITGIYILFVSISPEGRARAKNMILKLILSMILVSMSMELYYLLITISKALAYGMSSGAYINTSLLPRETRAELVLLWLFVGFITVIGWLVMALIKFLILLFAALFPFTIFFYLFDLTKSVGATLFKWTLMSAFSPVIMMLMLNIASHTLSMFYQLGKGEMFVAVFIIGGAFLLIALSPLMMLGILKWVGGAIAGVGVYMAMTGEIPILEKSVPGAREIGAAMTAVGGVGAGMGPGSLMAAGAAYSFGRAMKRTGVGERSRRRATRGTGP